MTRVGITGHQELSPLADRRSGEQPAWSWVEGALREALLAVPTPLVGLSLLAGGADQRFAELVLRCEGTLEVIVPFKDYRERLRGDARLKYDELIERAARVVHLTDYYKPRGAARDESYLEAGEALVDDSDQMFAVWERGRGGGPGSTSAIVAYARSQGRPLIIFDPRTRTAHEENYPVRRP